MSIPSDELNEQRLSRELRLAARAFDLTPGSELAVVTEGRRRRHRRRQMTAVAMVAAVGGGTAVAISQLAGTGDSSISTDEPQSTESPDSDTAPSVSVLTDPSIPPSSVQASVPDAAGGAGDGLDDVADAQLVDSNVVWTVVEPDSTAAVAYGETPLSIPGVMLATAPGRSNDFRPQFWETDDGINWIPLDIELPVGSGTNARFRGDTVYAVGTAPGIAANEPNPIVFAVSHDTGASWNEVVLPLDTNAGVDAPLVSGREMNASVFPIDGGAVVWVNDFLMLDYDALAQAVGHELDDMRAAGATAEGVQVRVDPACVPSYERDVPLFGSTPRVGPNGEPIDEAGCEVRTVAWSELGVPQEIVDGVFNAKPRAFRVVGDTAEEIVVPERIFPAEIGAEGLPFFTTEDGARWYQLDAAGAIVPVDVPGDGYGHRIGANATTTFVQRERYTPQWGLSSPVVGASTDGRTWQYADWTGLAGPGTLAWQQSAAVTSAGLVQVLQAGTDPVALEGGRSVSKGGFTISRETSDSPIVVTDDATGEQIDLSRVVMSGSRLVITDGSGGRLVDFDEAEFSPVVYSPGAVGQHEYLVATSSDAVNVAVESIAELLGVSNDEISSVPRVSAAGNTTVIAVTLKERNAEGVPRQVVLVGTPRT